jgi:hypothetical protein
MPLRLSEVIISRMAVSDVAVMSGTTNLVFDGL